MAQPHRQPLTKNAINIITFVILHTFYSLNAPLYAFHCNVFFFVQFPLFRLCLSLHSVVLHFLATHDVFRVAFIIATPFRCAFILRLSSVFGATKYACSKFICFDDISSSLSYNDFKRWRPDEDCSKKRCCIARTLAVAAATASSSLNSNG